MAAITYPTNEVIQANIKKWNIPMPQQDYMVVVHCSTYNHGKYIEDALKGFVMQQTDFSFCAIVIDDGSTDDTPAIIRRYAEQHPDIIKPILLGENHMQHGKSRNPYFDSWHEVAKYLAQCEGDDYWTDPLKLQKQVDYLESHPECCMCSHTADWEIDGNLYEGGCRHKNSCDLTTEEVIMNGGLYLATASLIYRKELENDKPEWMKMADVGDYPLQILGTLRGTLHYLPEIMCVYRYQHAESWTNKEKLVGINVNHLKTEIAWLELLNEQTRNNYSEAVYSHLIGFYSALYRNKQALFKDYLKAFNKASEHSYKRLFLDVLIRNFYGLYGIYKNVVTCKNS